MGGLWGARAEFFYKRNIENLIAQTAPSPSNFIYGDDQLWLRANVYGPALEEEQILTHDAFTSDEWPGAEPFPTPREGLEFVGERFTAKNEPFPGDRDELRKALQ